MLEIVLATRNENKVKELYEILKDIDIKIRTLNDFPEFPETIEDGNTFIENALKKAKEVFEHTGMLSLADDSGLEVDYLDGQPGIYSARFAGNHGDTNENNKKLLNLLKNVPENNREAQFHCALALIGNDISEVTEGICRGVILKESRGSNGFGYDPLFYYPTLNKTFAEMNSENKNNISHRAIAFAKMRNIVEKIANNL